MFQTVALPQSQLRCCAVGAVRAICELIGGTPAASCQDVWTAPAVVCMLFIPRVEFSATFRHVWSSQSNLVGVLLGQRSAYGRVCSWCPSNHKCVQFVFKTSLHHYTNIQSCYFMQQFISPAILGMFQTVAIPQSQLRCCAVGAVRAVCEAGSGFQKQLLALWCLHVGSLLHTDLAQPPRSQMTPFAWCPINR